MTSESSIDDGNPEFPIARIASLVDELEQLPESPARERARALVQAVLAIHRSGLARVIDLATALPDGSTFVDRLAADESIALLLSLHGLHTTSVEARVGAAVEKLRPALLAEGVAIEILHVGDDVVRVEVRAAGTVRVGDARLRAEIENAIYRGAPEIAAVEIDGLDGAPVVPAGRLSAPRT